jgi:hypothetical protein
MTLIDRLRGAAAERQKSALEIYWQTLRSPKSTPEAIVEAAASAGVAQGQIEAHVAVLDEARELGQVVSQLPSLVKAKAAAADAANAAGRALDEAVARLEPIAQQAAAEAIEAGRLERECRATMARLAALYGANPGLLPRDSAPLPLQQQWKVSEAQESHEASESARKKGLLARVAAAKQKVQEIESTMEKLLYRSPFGLPQGISGIIDVAAVAKDIPKAIERLGAALPEARAELEQAKQAAEQGGVSMVGV